MTEYAFPCIHEIDGNWQKEPSEEHRGMSLRDYFAAKAMHAYINSYPGDTPDNRDAPEWVPSLSYEMADAMLKARKK